VRVCVCMCVRVFVCVCSCACASVCVRARTHACTSDAAKHVTSLLMAWITLSFTHTHTHTATHCNILQHNESHCNTLQHSSTGCNINHCCWWRESHSLIHTQAHTHSRTLTLSYTHEQDTWHNWISHVTHIQTRNFHTHVNACKGVTSHIWTRIVTHVNESFIGGDRIVRWTCHNEWGMPHTQVSPFTCINESRHTYEWVTSHKWG